MPAPLTALRGIRLRIKPAPLSRSLAIARHPFPYNLTGRKGGLIIEASRPSLRPPNGLMGWDAGPDASLVTITPI